jgi:uncharacterized membrane protein YidH (DUF202 family)
MRKEGGMARTSQKTPTKRGVTLEAIEAHLKEQDRETKRNEWLAFIVFGVSIALSGAFLIVSRCADMVAYVFIVLYGLALAFYGLRRALKVG